MAELLDHLRAELARLPEKQAQVVWLRCVEEWSHGQVAEQLAISTGEVRVLLHRARARLQQLFATKPAPIVEKP
jgi:RNA polymerase sigma-70 factor (ECF subfamily)